ncbi:MAG: DUF2442 domain-containing protein [Deltaproteobacteria bacterium]|jgi:hypothetical protein|nr:DUF2442 domain-containing protein [Deltaproteobacteria bacterium]
MSQFGFIKLSHVEPRSDHTLLLTFETGEKRLYDFKPELNHPIFAPLKNISLFMQAKKQNYAVVWNDDLDIASEALYYNGTLVS